MTPLKPVTRRAASPEAVERLYNAAGCPAVSDGTSFADVSASASYADAVAWAENQGIIKGVTDSAFQPDTVITQAQFAAMVTRYAATRGASGASVDATVAEGLAYARDNGLLTGSAVTASTADYALTKLG